MASNKKSRQGQSQRKTGSPESAAGAAGGSDKKKSRRSGGKRGGHAAPSPTPADESPEREKQAALPAQEPQQQPSLPIVEATAQPKVASQPPPKVASQPPPKVASQPPPKVASQPSPKVASQPPPKVASQPPPEAEPEATAQPAPVPEVVAQPSSRVVVEEHVPAPTASGFDQLPISVAGFQAAWESAPDASSRLHVVTRVTDTLLRLVVALELGALGLCEARSRLETGVALASLGRPGAALTSREWAALAFSLARLASGKTAGAVGRLAVSLAAQPELSRVLQDELFQVERLAPGDSLGRRELRSIELLVELAAACAPIRAAHIVAVSGVVTCEGDDSIEYELRDVMSGSQPAALWSKRPLLRPWCYLLEDGALREQSLFPMAFAAHCAACDAVRIHLATRIAFGPPGAPVAGTCARCGGSREAHLPRHDAHPLERVTVIW